MLTQTTSASAIGLPWVSLHTPFTDPEAWAKTEGTHSPSARIANRRIAKCFFILPPGKLEFCWPLPQTNRKYIPLKYLSGRVRNRILNARGREGAQTQHTAVANSTSPIFPAVT